MFEMIFEFKKLDTNIRSYSSIFAVKIVRPIPNLVIGIHNPVGHKLLRISNLCLSYCVYEWLVVDHFRFWHEDRCPGVKEIETDRCF